MTDDERIGLADLLERIRYPSEYFNASDDQVFAFVEEIIRRVREEKR